MTVLTPNSCLRRCSLRSFHSTVFYSALACLDIYPNIDRIKKVKCPVMIIHGRLDEEVDVAHGVAMHQAVPDDLKREPWWVPDRGHNDITDGPGKLSEYIQRLRRFLTSLDGE